VKTSRRIALGLCSILIYALNIAPASAAEKITLTIAADQIGGYSIVKPKVGAGCYLTGGRWRSSYDGKIFTNPTGLDIDHMVPLAEAWRSGAWAWTAAQRMDFANDLEDPRSLLAVTASLNRSKGDRDVAGWLPTRAQCNYISNWIAVKWRFDLTVDPIEGEFLQSKITSCKITNVVIN
jgi:hypothetical protein